MLRNPVKNLLHKTHFSHHLDRIFFCIFFFFAFVLFHKPFFLFALFQQNSTKEANFISLQSPKWSRLHQRKLFYPLLHTLMSTGHEGSRKPPTTCLKDPSCNQLQWLLSPSIFRSATMKALTNFLPSLIILCTHVNSKNFPRSYHMSTFQIIQERVSILHY